MKTLFRLALIVPLLWLLGFVWFVFSLPGEVVADDRTDGIVVLTGGPGRLAHGVELLQENRGQRLLVSGVDQSVRAEELAAEVGAPQRLFDCCIDLGKRAENTVGNAAEIAAWAQQNGYTSLRVVTASDHMPRALQEIRAEVGDTVRLIPNPVRIPRTFGSLAREYSKFVVRRLQRLAGTA
ncbi:MAG: YdcF family protein [Pacificimonas sp.]|jgi:uncharacterized SAM-binding protein YcdF (DUF218 family)|nr:YdcF family protein [Pacificimonas sp.]